MVEEPLLLEFGIRIRWHCRVMMMARVCLRRWAIVRLVMVVQVQRIAPQQLSTWPPSSPQFDPPNRHKSSRRPVERSSRSNSFYLASPWVTRPSGVVAFDAVAAVSGSSSGSTFLRQPTLRHLHPCCYFHNTPFRTDVAASVPDVLPPWDSSCSHSGSNYMSAVHCREVSLESSRTVRYSHWQDVASMNRDTFRRPRLPFDTPLTSFWQPPSRTSAAPSTHWDASFVDALLADNSWPISFPPTDLFHTLPLNCHWLNTGGRGSWNAWHTFGGTI